MLTSASAQDTDFDWVDPAGDVRYANAVLTDLDGDGLDDLAIGTLERCGAVEVWLSTATPRLGLPHDGPAPCCTGPSSGTPMLFQALTNNE